MKTYYSNQMSTTFVSESNSKLEGLKHKFQWLIKLADGASSEKQNERIGFCRIVHFILKIENFSRVNQM